METTLERLRERAEEVVRQAPEVEAVVLFGSRARGTAGPGSDWDVALIEKSGKAPEAAYRLLDALPGVRLLGIEAGEIERHKDTAGALEAALARQGVTLAGAWQRPACRKEALTMEVVRIRAHLANATDQMDKAVRAGIEHLYAMEWERGDWTLLTTGSADAAEHVAKAVLTGYGLSPREVHFLDALAEQLANAYRGRNDPRQAEWAERIRAMNGTTRTLRLHDADYRRFVAPRPSRWSEVSSVPGWPNVPRSCGFTRWPSAGPSTRRRLETQPGRSCARDGGSPSFVPATRATR